MKFGARLTTTDEDHNKINFPGPGSYNDINGTSINQYGNYISSNLRNSGAQRFSVGARVTETHHDLRRRMTPGPGAYKD